MSKPSAFSSHRSRKYPFAWLLATAALGIGCGRGCLDKAEPTTTPEPTTKPDPAPIGPAERAEEGAAPAEASQPAPFQHEKPASGSALDAESAPRRASPQAPTASRPTMGAPTTSSSALHRLQRQVESAFAQFERVTALDSRDCSAAEQHRDTICSLAERICGLGPEDPHRVSIAAYCADARNRCARARQRYEQACSN
jgi:hypothetical protein